MPAVRATDFRSPITKDHFKHPVDQESARKLARQYYTIKSVQTTAVDAAAVVGFIAEGTGRVVNVRALVGGSVAAANESMTFDVLKNGTSVLSALATIDSTIAVDTWVEGTLKTDGTPTFALGDLITFTRDYTAGGGPTPMTNTLLIIEVEYENGR